MLWSVNKAANLWKDLNGSTIAMASSGVRVINYAIKGISVCKSFYKRATGINPGLFDKVVRAVLAGTPYRQPSRRSLVTALTSGPLAVKFSVGAVKEHLLTMQQRHALLVMDMIFIGRLLALVCNCYVKTDMRSFQQTKACNLTQPRRTVCIALTHGNRSTN